MTQLAVIHVDASFPCNAARVDIKLVALFYVIVNHRRKQIVCRTDCVKIPGKMEIDILHRNNLGISAACRAALYAEHRAERRLTQSNDYVFTYAAKPVRKSDCRCGLAFPCGCRGHGGNKNKSAVRLFAVFEYGQINLCLVSAILLKIFFFNPGGFCYLRYVFRCDAVCYLDIGPVLHKKFPRFLFLQL